MRGRVLQRLRSRRGFTLAEQLMTMIILLLVTAMVANTIPVVKDLLDRTVDAANARTLLSTTVTLLRDELSLAQPVSIGNGEGGVVDVTYVSGKTGAQNRIFYVDTGEEKEKGIQIKEYLKVQGVWDSSGEWQLGEDGASEPPGARSLVSDAAATKTLRTKFSGIQYEDGVYTISGLKVIRKKDDTALVTLNELKIRNIRTN